MPEKGGERRGDAGTPVPGMGNAIPIRISASDERSKIRLQVGGCCFKACELQTVDERARGAPVGAVSEGVSRMDDRIADASDQLEREGEIGLDIRIWQMAPTPHFALLTPYGSGYPSDMTMQDSRASITDASRSFSWS